MSEPEMGPPAPSMSTPARVTPASVTAIDFTLPESATSSRRASSSTSSRRAPPSVRSTMAWARSSLVPSPDAVTLTARREGAPGGRLHVRRIERPHLKLVPREVRVDHQLAFGFAQRAGELTVPEGDAVSREPRHRSVETGVEMPRRELALGVHIGGTLADGREPRNRSEIGSTRPPLEPQDQRCVPGPGCTSNSICAGRRGSRTVARPLISPWSSLASIEASPTSIPSILKRTRGQSNRTRHVAPLGREHQRARGREVGLGRRREERADRDVARFNRELGVKRRANRQRTSGVDAPPGRR